MAASYAAAGRFTEAISTAQRSIAAAEAAEQAELAHEIQERLTLYQAGKPYRQRSVTRKLIE